MKIKVGDLTRRQILKICDKSTVGSIHCSKTCPLYRANNICLCRAVDDKDLAIEIDLETEENSNEEYWLDKMNKNPRYREIWEKIKEQPFHQTTEMILELELKLAEKDEEIKGYLGLMDNYIYQIDTLKKCGDADHFYLLLEEKRNENEILSKAYKQLEQSQNETAINKLEKVKEFIIKNNEPTRKITAITKFINCQIQELQGRLQNESMS